MKLAVTAWSVLTVSEFLTELDTISTSRSRFENFRDFIETAYGGLASEVYGNRPYKAVMERRFRAILENYGEERHESLYSMWGLFSRLVMTMLQSEGDFLADVYRAAGFPRRVDAPITFPYQAAQELAEKGVDPEELEQVVRAGKAVIIQDHQCGTGSMTLAAARRVRLLGHAPADAMLVLAPDTDVLCMQMTYLQAAVHQIPAICLHVDEVKRRVREKAFTAEAITVIERLPDWPIRPERFARGERSEAPPPAAPSEAGGGNTETGAQVQASL